MSTREKIYIVDKKDNIIGEKWRDELTDDDCWRIVSIWITDNEGRVLLQKRSENKKVSPGIWTAATEGTVDYGEGYDTTAYREVFEEVGITDMELSGVEKYYGSWGGFGKRQCQGYKGVFDGDKSKIKYQESEVASIGWFTANEIEELYKTSPDLFPLYPIYKELGFIS